MLLSLKKRHRFTFGEVGQVCVFHRLFLPHSSDNISQATLRIGPKLKNTFPTLIHYRLVLFGNEIRCQAPTLRKGGIFWLQQPFCRLAHEKTNILTAYAPIETRFDTVYHQSEYLSLDPFSIEIGSLGVKQRKKTR